MRSWLAAFALLALSLASPGPASAQGPGEAGAGSADAGAAGARSDAGRASDPAQGSDPAPGTDPASDPPDASAAGPGSDPTADAPPASELPEEHRPALTLSLDTGAGVRTGDVVHVVITAEVPEGDDVAVPDQELGTFEIFDRRYRSEAVAEGRRRRFHFELDLLALEPGEQALPPVRLRVVTADGEVGTVTTEARTVEVGSHLGNEPDAQPRPATAPVPVMEEDYTLLWVLGALAVLLVTALISWLVTRWWSRRPSRAKPAPPPRPPWDVAIEKLEAIRREKASLLAQEKQVELVDRVSDVLRDYLGQRYDFNGLESTTDEVVSRLASIKLRGVKLEEVTALLADSDLVKFAKALFDEAQCDRMLEGAMRIVRETTPRPRATASARLAAGGRGARIVSKDGEVTLPLSARTIEEAEREIRAAVGPAFREAAQDPSFEGTLRVALSPSLTPDANTEDALRRLYGRLASELARMSLPSGRRPRLVIEHFHSSLRAAAETGLPALRTVIDEAGVRVEERAPAAARTSRALEQVSASATVAATEPRSARVEAARPDAAAIEPHGAVVEPAGAASEPRAAAVEPGGPAHAIAREPRVKTGPVEWDRSAVSKQETARDARGARAQDPHGVGARRPIEARPIEARPIEARPIEARPIEASDARPEARLGDASAGASRPTDARALDRVLPTFVAGTGAEGALIRWITGLERPVSYAVDGEALGVGALRSLGLTRAGLHERALANARRAVPPGFAPGAEPAMLDDRELATILALPDLVPAGDAWIVYPSRSEGLVVLREDAPSTREELARLERARRADPAPVFERPVRMTRRGFEPLDWPAVDRTTDPGFASPDAAAGGRGDGETGGAR